MLNVEGCFNAPSTVGRKLRLVNTWSRQHLTGISDLLQVHTRMGAAERSYLSHFKI